VAHRLIIWGLDMAGGKAVDADHHAIVVGCSQVKDATRKIYVPWWWHHRHVDVFALADVVRVVRDVFPPNLVIGDDGGHAAIATLDGLSRKLHLNIQPKPRDVMISVRDMNDELRTGRLLLATQDMWTDKIVDVARKVYAAEPERFARVESLLLNRPTPSNPRNAKLDLAKELGQVLKSVNPTTKKVEVNKRGKHSDGSEACRYMVSGFVRAPAIPEKPKPTTEDERIRLQDMEYARKQAKMRRRPFG
jgi:hypothetical protein